VLFFDYILRFAGEKQSVTYNETEDLYQILFKNSKAATHAHEMFKISREVHTHKTRKFFMEILASEKWRTND
jgi:hypothetical protein